MHSTERAELRSGEESIDPVGGQPLVVLPDGFAPALSPPATGRMVRAFDIVGASALILLFAPIALLCAVLVKLGSPGPVVYRAERLAHGGGTFTILKFRSMVTNGDEVIEEYFRRHPDQRARYEHDLKLIDDPRVTAIGHWLRVLSLDELPQLINVLRGDMSLVGPRPKLLSERSHYGHRMEHVLTVRPGLTGLWQVSGRSSASYEQRIEMDLAYVENRSLLGDVSICLKTAGQLLRPNAEEAH